MSRSRVPAPPPVLRDRTRERAARSGLAEAGRAATTRTPTALGLGAGERLPARERRDLESRLDAESSAAARLNARAFAAGRDIASAPGEWAPDRAEGRRLLGHELAHVVQQRAHGAAVQLEGTPKPEEAPSELEKVLKTIAEKARDNEQMETELLDPAKAYALRP